MEVEDAKKLDGRLSIIGYTDIEDPWEKIQKSVGHNLDYLRKLAIEKEHMNVERYEQIQQYFACSYLVSAEEKLHERSYDQNRR